MIYITGDLHGDIERIKKLPVRLKKQDTLIVLGDFGFVWNAGAEEQKQLAWLGRRPYQILFLDGAHENHDLLDRLPAEDFAGGRACRVSGNLWRLLRGEIYTLEEKTYLCMGGGETPDKDSRQEGESWWPQELPTDADYENCRKNLAAHGGRVDVVLTHDVPARTLRLLTMNEEPNLETNRLQEFLEELYRTAKWDKWFFARLHLDRTLGPKTSAVYRKVLPAFEPAAKKGWFAR